MHIALLAGRSALPWGPRVGVRWWRFGARCCWDWLCAASGSGVYFVLFFSAMALAFDIGGATSVPSARWLGTVRRDVFPAGMRWG